MPSHIIVAITGKHADTFCEDVTTTEIESLSCSSSFDRPPKTLMQSYTTTTGRPFPHFRQSITDSNPNDSIEGHERSLGARTGGQRSHRTYKGSSLHYTLGRPCLSRYTREPVEAPAGETFVVVCGGESLTSPVRNCIATLSDERTVHKGTGVEGVHLRVEDCGM